MSNRIHVLIADDHAIVRQGLKQILSETLLKLGIIEKDFTGPVLIKIVDGGIRDAEKTIRFK